MNSDRSAPSEMLEWRLLRQLDSMIPDNFADTIFPAGAIDEAVRQVERGCAPLIGQNEHSFDPLVSWQFATFLYRLARIVAALPNGEVLATRLFLLNKALNGIDLYHAVEMPDFFLIGHTVGMVFANAKYENYCIFHQNCTVGRLENNRPRLGRGVVMYPGSSIIGKCDVAENTVLSAGVQLVNCDTPANCIVFTGENGRPTFKPITEVFAERYYTLP